MEIDTSCPTCKSLNTVFNKENGCYYCLEPKCDAIWCQHYQRVITLSNIIIPDSSSDDNSSKDES